MRAVVQRVKRAKVVVEGEEVAAIGQGLLVFIGIHREDGDKDLDYIVRKVTGLRVFEDREGKMNLSVQDIGGEILLVSQFTLYGDVRRGKRPSFTEAMPPQQAQVFFVRIVEAFKQAYPRVKTGVFQAMMDVELINDGPVTILMDSRKLF